MIGELIPVIAPVFICAAIGFVWQRSGRAFPEETLGNLVMNVGTPCLIFSTLATVGMDPAALGAMSLAATAVFGVAGAGLLWAGGLSLRGFTPTLMFPNSGNLGLPLALFAFGEEGLALGIAYFVINAIGQHTVGLSIASGSVSLFRYVRSPIIYAVALAALFMSTGLAVPRWIANTTDLIGGMTIPLLLITLGNSLARLKVTGMGRSLGVSLVRLLMGFAVGVGIAEALGWEGVARGVMILQSSMPVAVFSYLYAQTFRTEPEEVAGAVVISTILSFLTLPLLLWYVM